MLSRLAILLSVFASCTGWSEPCAACPSGTASLGRAPRSYYEAHVDLGAPEVPRIQQHLRTVERILRARDVSSLPAALRTMRSEHLDRLHEYCEAGIFPRNDSIADLRPFFIDSDGRECAVGHLMVRSGAVALAHEIAARQNHAYLGEIEVAGAPEWIAGSGLTAEELAWIQPTYGPCNNFLIQPPVMPDPTELTVISEGLDVRLSGLTIVGSGWVGRDGESIGMLAAGDTEFLDEDVTPGLHIYSVYSASGTKGVRLFDHYTGAANRFIRGDANGDGALDIADAIAALTALFVGPEASCVSSLDANDDGAANIADPISLLGYAFGVSPPPGAPFPACGLDPTPDGLDCAEMSASCPATGEAFPYSITSYHQGSSGYPQLGDVTGDGIPDLVTGKFFSYSGGVISRRSGAADGSFYPWSPSTITWAQGWPGLSDLDADGDLDLVVYLGDELALWYGIRTYQNNGTGQFTLVSDVAAPVGSCVGEFTADSFPDIASIGSGTLEIRAGLGDGTFAPPIPVPGAWGSAGIITGDWNDDGVVDLAFNSNGIVTTVLADGAGAFSAAIVTTGITGYLPEILSPGDLDGVEGDDLLMRSSNGLQVLLSDGDGSFTISGVLPEPYTAPYLSGDAKCIDFDGDGVTDLISLVKRSSSTFQEDSTLRFWRGLGAGGFSLTRTIRLPTRHERLVIADLNGDGGKDIVLGGSGCSSYFMVFLREAP